MAHETNHEEAMQPVTTHTTSRRDLFRLGGFTFATAVIAACSDTEDNKIGQLGAGDETPALPDAEINDGVWLRTMAGIEFSITNAVQRILEEGLLSGASATYPSLGDTTQLLEFFHHHHSEAAAHFNELAVQQGAVAWECGNPRLDSAYIFPVFDRVLSGVAATDTAKEIAPSDDPVRDFANLLHALESLSAESCQALVALVTDPELRRAAVQNGVWAARNAAHMALLLNPGGYVPAAVAAAAPAAAPSDAPPLTEIPLPVALPAQFGLLSAITYVGGNGDENGVRLKLNLETPSLNSMAYTYMECAAG